MLAKKPKLLCRRHLKRSARITIDVGTPVAEQNRHRNVPSDTQYTQEETFLVGDYLFLSTKFCMGKKHFPPLRKSVLLAGVSFQLLLSQLCWDVQAVRRKPLQYTLQRDQTPDL